MSKFILIDPSIQGFSGHYYEYALRVARAAEVNGFSPLIAAHQDCQAKSASPISIIPVHRDAFWFRSGEHGWYNRGRRAVRQLRRWAFLLRVWFTFSRLGMLFFMRGSITDCVQRSSVSVRSDRSLFALLAAGYVLKVSRAVFVAAKHAMPLRAYLSILVGDFSALGRALVGPALDAFKQQGPIARCIWTRFKLRRFHSDIRELFRRTPLDHGDVVFLSLVSTVEIVALARYFDGAPESQKATWHLLFRHQIYTAESGGPYSESNRPIRAALYLLKSFSASHRIRFYTDTDDLTAQYNTLKIAPFETLPIPLDERYHLERRTASPRGPLQIAYLGDARPEKGYQHLPQIVEDLWTEFVAAGRVHFVIQSNFNVPEGAPATVIARAQLEAFPPDKVKLQVKPLSPSKYRELVVGSDIILLPYDRTAYYAGSSGILAEALSAGVPVIVPEGTWMAKQLADATRSYHEMLRDSLVNLGTWKGDQRSWRIRGERRSRPWTDGTLCIGPGERAPYTVLNVPKGAEFMLCSVGPGELDSQSPVCFQLDQRNALGDQARTVVRHLSVAARARRTLLIPLDVEAARVRLQVRQVTANSPSELRDVRIDFLARRADSDACPLGAVGLAFGSPDELTGLIRELIEHYAHYRKSALAYSEEWFRRHNASRLVTCLRTAA